MSGFDPNDLTGKWDGMFNYPDGHDSTAFTAIIRDSAGAIAGEISEHGYDSSCDGTLLHALLEGRHDGGEVEFLKIYDEQNEDYRTVEYAGTVSSDGVEISGRWNIPGIWSGTFIMVRSRGKAASAERRATVQA